MILVAAGCDSEESQTPDEEVDSLYAGPQRGETIDNRVRVEAAERLRLELGGAVLQRPAGRQVHVDAIFTEYDAHGNLRELHASGVKDGLAVVTHKETAAGMVQRFLVEHGGLWADVALVLGKDEGEPPARNGIVVAQVEHLRSPSGDVVDVVHLKQYRNGIELLDGDTIAVVWNGHLTKISGPLVGPDYDFGQTDFRTSQNSEELVVVVAEHELEARGLESVESHVASIGYSIEHRALVARVESAVYETSNTEFHRTKTVEVDLGERRVLSVTDHDGHWPTVTGSYDAYKPFAGDTTASSARLQTLPEQVTRFSASTFLPWRDEFTVNRSPVITYDANTIWGGSLGFPFNGGGSPSFAALENTDAFQVQHLSYWLQRAVRAADVNFNWWPPSNAAYKTASVVGIANVSDAVMGSLAGWAGTNGCWNQATWDNRGDVGQNPRVTCIRFRGSLNFAPGKKGTPLGVIFHEVGHAIDYKYGGGNGRANAISGACNVNTAEESWSLGETIPSLYSMMMMFHEFGTATGFTDEDGDGSANGLASLSSLGTPAHQGDSSLRCHAATGDDCAQVYSYGAALVQAYWEIALGLSCDGPEEDACYVMPDTARADQARWALFYAMKVSSRNSTFKAFTADILGYYYNAIGYDEWASRWWVFNHHGLVGPDYGYSPCHSD